MKKIALCTVIAIATTFVSCKKDRTCTCTSVWVLTTPGNTTTSTSVSAITYTKAKKADARKECLNSVETGNQGQNTYTLTKSCSLK